ncbi:MAG: methyl-plastoquinone biosynthesis methyltransferase MpqE [Nitrospiria bacterium]
MVSSTKNPEKYSLENKEKNVQRMFSSIADKYDLNNTLLSLGVHHFWKKKVVRMAALPDQAMILDIASGTGDIAIELSKEKKGSKIAASDLNWEMLKIGARKIAAKGLASCVFPVLGNAEKIQFRDSSFDLVTVGFGLRNCSDIPAVLHEAFRVLKPEGQFICLEFSKPVHMFWRKLYDFYSFTFLPKIGQWVSRDQTGVYQYLPHSIRNFPDQETFKSMIEEAGFKRASYTNLTGGIVAIHTGYKP